MPDTAPPLPRDQFPVVERFRYFNHAGVAPLPRVAADVGHAFLDEVVHQGSVGHADWDRRIDAVRLQVILDGEGHRTLKAGRREDVAGMAGIGEPLHDRAQALRHTGGRVADAVVIGEKEPHNRAYKP